MEVLFVLIPISLAISWLFLLAFIWAVKGGQFDDLEKPAYELLHDDPEASHQGHSDKSIRGQGGVSCER